MKDEILFGAAYYPEYMPCDRMDTDMQMMKNAGINVIRVAESTWSMLEPLPMHTVGHPNVIGFQIDNFCGR